MEAGVTVAMPQAAAPGIVVADPRSDSFSRIRLLGLDTAIWRTAEPPAGRALPEGTLVVVVTTGEPPWEAVRECAKRYPTIVAATEPRPGDDLLALRAGAFGYVDLQMRDDGLRRTLLGSLHGEPAFTRGVLGVWLREGRARQRGAEGGPTDRLTQRQREIIGLIAGGATDKEIGAQLGIRTATAQKHVANLLRRLGVANRAAAVGAVFTAGTAPAVTALGRRRR